MLHSIKRIIPFPLAVWSVLILNSIIIIFHLLIVLQFIPYNIAWAGRLHTVQEMYVFESAAIAINGLLLFVALTKGDLVQAKIPARVITIVLWIFVVIFVLNTLGNLTAATSLERMIATPLTFVLAIFCWRLAIQ